MKFTVPFILMLALGMQGCGPKKSTPGPDNYYHASIPTQLKLSNTGSTNLGIDIDPGTKATDSLTITVTGWPANVKGTLSFAKGIPPFICYVNASAHFATPGTYPLQLQISSVAAGVYNYPVNLIVEPTDDCASSFIGAYGHSTVSNDTGVLVLSFMEMVTQVNASRIKINRIGFYIHSLNDVNAYADVDCISGTFTVAPQKPEMQPSFPPDIDSIKGNGFFANSVLVFKYAMLPTGGAAWKNYTDSMKY